MFTFVNVELINFDFIICMSIDSRRRDINNIKGKVALFWDKHP